MRDAMSVRTTSLYVIGTCLCGVTNVFRACRVLSDEVFCVAERDVGCVHGHDS